jgi:hypothetical protein
MLRLSGGSRQTGRVAVAKQEDDDGHSYSASRNKRIVSKVGETDDLD